MTSALTCEIAPGRRIGDGQPCFVIAEIGSNHNHDFSLATRMIDEAAAAGGDAVKFQTFKALDIVSPHVKSNAYSGWDVSEKFEYWYQFVETLEMPLEWYDELIELTRKLDLAFISSECNFWI